MAASVPSRVYNVNDLPDEVLNHIISFLPIKEAVQTSIMSKRWRYLFTLMTSLDFEVRDYHEEEKLDRFLNFLDRLVLMQDIRSIQRFRVRSYHHIDPQRVYRWMCALTWSKIQELDLRTSCKEFCGLPSPLPESLFSCENLVILKLNLGVVESFDLKVPARICLPCLKVLHLEAIGLPNDGSEETLFSSCLALEDLVLIKCSLSKGCLKFIVSNQSLKRLTMKSITSKGETTIPILIIAPNMVYLSYSISTDHSLELIDAKSLAEADIDFQLSGPGRGRYVTAAPGALSQIQNIQTLRINNCVIIDFKRFNVLVPLFEKMTCLRIWKWELWFKHFGFESFCFEYILANCVVLENLVFEESTTSTIHSRVRYGYRKCSLEKSRLCPLLQHLKTIEIQLNSIIQLEVLRSIIEFFLKNAGALEELKIKSRQGSPEQQVEIMTKLMNVPRASEKCTLLFDALK